MINKLLTISLLILFTITFSACEDKKSNTQVNKEKKEIKFTPKLPIPSGSQEIRDTKLNMVSLWYKAKHDPVPAMKIGYAYSEELHDYEKAFEWFKYANSMIPLGENSYFACYALQQLKRYDEAISWCNNAIELKWDKALVLLGSVYSDANKYNEAAKYYIQSFEKTKDGLSANNLGYLYSTKIKDYKEAEKWYKEAIQHDYKEAYQNIANFYFDRLNDKIKASAYAIALINTIYTEDSVIRLLKNDMKIPNETIQKGYELQLNSPEFPIHYDGKLDLE
ncbi:hypothetical protein CRV08_09615 [Halarcobacter ebronensis]|uniref:Uncharacterized protein n=1 Tax=Halarcobacter ebronensis TaxID=1462615 RepID=A0A4Q0YBC1_9BACT|nr:tetratricopeptide repeat protein [Halarcobacter ebronensis]RXJ67617.1 hypothetical protein CRV08_09615 [Halarcobacter ebronensis]